MRPLAVLAARVYFSWRRTAANTGFTLEASNDALRNPADNRTKPFYDESFRGKSTDRFVLLFRKKAE